MGFLLGELGNVACEMLVYRGIPQFQPGVEPRPVHGGLFGQCNMNRSGIAGVTPFIEQNEAPEIGHLVEMMVPIDPGHLIEDRTNRGVFRNALVEQLYQRANVRAFGKLSFQIWFAIKGG